MQAHTGAGPSLGQRTQTGGVTRQLRQRTMEHNLTHRSIVVQIDQRPSTPLRVGDHASYFLLLGLSLPKNPYQPLLVSKSFLYALSGEEGISGGNFSFRRISYHCCLLVIPLI